jgi:hypothetical protein
MGIGDIRGEEKTPITTSPINSKRIVRGSSGVTVNSLALLPIPGPPKSPSPRSSPLSPFSRKGKLRSLFHLTNSKTQLSASASAAAVALEDPPTPDPEPPSLLSSVSAGSYIHKMQDPPGKGGYNSDVGGARSRHEAVEGLQASLSEDEANITPRRGRRKSAMNFIKRKFLSKGDDVAGGHSDYDSDRSSRSRSNSKQRGWGKSRSTGALDTSKPRSISRDSSPGRLRSYLGVDQYRRDESYSKLHNNDNSNSNSSKDRTKKNSGRPNANSKRNARDAEDKYAPSSTPVENDISVPAHEFNQVKIKRTVPGYTNLLHKIYDGVNASDTEAVQGNLEASQSMIRRKTSITDDEADDRIPSSRSSVRRTNNTKAYTDDELEVPPATPAAKPKPRVNRKSQQQLDSDSDGGDGDDDDDNDGRPKPRPTRRASIPKRTDGSDMGEMPLKSGSPPEEGDSARRRKSNDSPNSLKKKKSVTANGESSSLNSSKGSIKTKGIGSKKSSIKKAPGDTKRDRASGVRSSDRSVASNESKNLLMARNSSMPNMPEQEQEIASPGGNGDLMDAPVPLRRKFSSFKEEKEKMERELLFNKLEVVRMQELLSEAVEKAEELEESQKKDKLEFEKVLSNLKQQQQNGSASPISSDPATAAAGLDYEHRRKLQMEIAQLKKENYDKDLKIDALNDEIQEHVCKVEHLEEELKSAEEDMTNMQNDMQNLENELAVKEQDEDNWLTDDDDSDKPMKKDEKTRRQHELEEWEKRLELRERELKQQESHLASKHSSSNDLGSSKNRGMAVPRKISHTPNDDFDDEGSVEMTQSDKTGSSLKIVPDSMAQMAMEVKEKEMAEMRSWVLKSAKELDADRALFEDSGPQKIKALTKEVETLRTTLKTEQARHEEDLRKKEKLSHSYRKDLQVMEELYEEEKTKRKEDASYWDEVERDMNQQLKERNDEKKSLEFKLERTQRRADTTESKLDAARMDMQDQLSKIAELQKAVTEVKYAPQKDSKLEQELERLQLKNDQLRDKIAKLEEMQGNASGGSFGQQKDRGAPASPSKSDDRKLQKELDRLQAKNDALRDRLEKYESQGGGPVKTTVNSSKDNDEKIRSLQEQITFLKLDLKEKASMTDKLTASNKKLEMDLADARVKRERESERLQDTIEELIMNRDELDEELSVFRKERDADVKRLSLSVGKHQDENEKLEAKVKRLSVSVDRLQDENEKLEARVRQVGSEVSRQSTKAQEEEIAGLLESVATLMAENKSLKEDRQAVAGKHSRQLESQSAEIAQLNARLDKVKKENGELNETVRVMNDQAKTTVKVQEAEITKLKASVNVLKQDNARLADRATEAVGEEAKKTVKVQEAEIARLQNQLKETFKQFEKRHPKEFPPLLQELKIRKGEVETVRKSMYEIQARNKQLENELMEMSQRFDFDVDISERGRRSGDSISLEPGSPREVSKAPSADLKRIQEELNNWKTTATAWQTKAEESVKESLEWKRRAEEWEQEAAQWETVATESQAAAALGSDEQAMALAAMDVTTQLTKNGAENDEDRIRGLSRQNAALNDRIAEIQNELRTLVGNDVGRR